MAKPTNESISIAGLFVWSVGALFFLYEFFLRTFLGALGKQIIPALQLTPSQFALLASAFYISYGLMQVPIGAITDRFGLKLSMCFATFMCSLSALWFAYAHTFIIGLICRFLMGLGGGFAFLCLLIITIDWLPKKRLALFVGAGQFTGTMGALIAGGPLASIVVSAHIPWRTVFIFIALAGFFIFMLASLFVKKRKQDRENEVVILNTTHSIRSKIRQLIHSTQAWWVAIYSAFIFLSVAMLGAVWGTIYLQSIGYSQQTAASIVSLAWLGFACGCPILGGVSDYIIKRKPVMMLCSLIGTIDALCVVYIPLPHAWLYGVLFFILGVTASGQSIGFAIITEHVPPEAKSMALGLNSAFITLLAALVPIIVGLVIEHVAHITGAHTKHYAYHDFILAFSIMPLLYFLSLIISTIFIKETYCRSKKELVRLET